MANTHAKELVTDAAKRLRALDYDAKLEAMDDKKLRIYSIKLLEENLIVSGAVLQEVSNGVNGGWQKKLWHGVVQNIPPFAGMGGVLFLLSVLGVI